MVWQQVDPTAVAGCAWGLERGVAVSTADIEEGLRNARLHLHAGATVNSAVVSAIVAVAVTALLWPHAAAAAAAVAAWLVALALALGARLRLGLTLTRALQAGGVGGLAAGELWLRRARHTFVAHGVVWGLGGLWWMTVAPPEHTQTVLFTLTALGGGALLATPFDRRAARCFTLPCMVPALVAVLWSDPGQWPLVGVILLMLTVVHGVSGRMGHAVGEIVRLRSLEKWRAAQALGLAAQADAARLALADQHRLLSHLLETTSQGCWFVDIAGVTTDVNPAMCGLLGRPREALMGRSVLDFFDGDDVEVLRRQSCALAEGRNAPSELRIERPDGTRLNVRCEASPLFDAQGRHVGAVALWTDLTAHVQAEHALRTYRVVTNAITDLVSVIDEHLVYRLVNDAWCRSTGYTREHAVGRTTAELLPRLAAEVRGPMLKEALELQQPRVALSRVSLPAMSERVMETHYYPYGLDAEGRRCVVAVTRDVSDKEAAREALDVRDEYLRRTLNATGDAIFASDAEGPTQPVRFVNAQMLAMWGIPAEEATSLTPAGIMARAAPLFIDREAELRRIDVVIRFNLADEARLSLRDGRVLLRRCVPAPLPGGTLRVWSFRDITAEVRALEEVQESASEQQALLEAFPGYIAQMDEQLRYRFANHRMAALLGSTPAQIQGRTVGEVVGLEREAVVKEAVLRALAGERVLLDRYHPAVGGRGERHLQVTLAAGTDPRSGRRSVYAFGVDVTELKQAQAALTAARDGAEQANQAKSRFLSQMSHELRTPLNAILGFAQLLDRQAQPPLPPPQKSQVQEIQRGARHLLALINEVLDLGRVEAGALAMDLQAVPVAALLDDVVGLVQGLADSHQVRLMPAPRPVVERLAVRADPMRLKQVLLNLLGNAIKFNRAGGTVALLCQVQDAELTLTVQDTGPGLAADDAARLFQPFERLGAERRGVEGSGIGLALCRGLLQAMGGAMGVHSTLGEGAAFWIRLPAVPLPAPAWPGLPTAWLTPESGLLPEGLQALREGPVRQVLCVEDNPINATLMQAMLAPLTRLQVHLAANGAEALAVVAQTAPDLVLLDIQLPGMDGFEVLRRLRSQPATAAVPVVAISANAHPADIATALAAGFSAYLTKPVDMDTLHQAVLSALRLG